MKKEQVTPKQFDRFKAIADFIKQKGRFPVNREICEMFGLSSTSSSALVLKQFKKHNG